MGELWPVIAQRALPAFSLALRVAFLLLGVAILLGLIPLPGESRNRTLFASICILYGVFGVLRVTVFRQRRPPRDP